MRVLRGITWVVVLGFAVALGASACGSASPDSHPGHGIVKGIDHDVRQVTLDHEDIPGFMKGMTMTFNVSPDVRLEGIDLGAEVDFRVKDEGGIITVTDLRRSGS